MRDISLRFAVTMLVGAAFVSPTIARAGTFTTLYEFGSNPNDGSAPMAALIARSGILYGTTSRGGYNDAGTVFSFNSATGSETVVTGLTGFYTFEPVAFRGPTLFGSEFGPSNVSQIYSVDPGTGETSILYSFKNEVYTRALVALGGKLYGSNGYGGAHGKGSVFSFNPRKNHVKYLYSFMGGDDGNFPLDMIANAGLLYGETLEGGSASAGTIFSVDPATGNETTLYTFTGGADGGAPTGVAFYKGEIYGVTRDGGANGHGTIFAYNPSTQQFSIVYTFPKGIYGDYGPPSLAIQSGTIYGIAKEDGVALYKSILYKVDIKSGIRTVLHVFSKGPDGDAPYGNLLAYKGVIYGTTSNYGTYGAGTIFSYTP